jgi:hypothetical protein
MRSTGQSGRAAISVVSSNSKSRPPGNPRTDRNAGDCRQRNSHQRPRRTNPPQPVPARPRSRRSPPPPRKIAGAESDRCRDLEAGAARQSSPKRRWRVLVKLIALHLEPHVRAKSRVSPIRARPIAGAPNRAGYPHTRILATRPRLFLNSKQARPRQLAAPGIDRAATHCSQITSAYPRHNRHRRLAISHWCVWPSACRRHNRHVQKK